MKFFEPGSEAFIVTNGRRVRPVKVLYENYGLYTLLFMDGGPAGIMITAQQRLFCMTIIPLS